MDAPSVLRVIKQQGGEKSTVKPIIARRFVTEYKELIWW
jgi:hypothetical protein